MDSRFESQKREAMKKLSDAVDSGNADKGILPLLEFINSLEDFYSTSSCSGRVVLLHDMGNKLDSSWLGKWHREVGVDEVLAAMKNPPAGGTVLFKYESAILHLVARDLKGAKKLLVIAREAGYKRAGIQGLNEDRHLVEICDTGSIDVPIIEKGKVLVDDNYMGCLVALANKKFRNGMEKLERLEKNIKDNLIVYLSEYTYAQIFETIRL